MRNIWRRRAREKTREIKAENRAHRKFKSTRGVKAIMAGEDERQNVRASARRWVAGVCVVTGFVLLVLTAAGHFTSLGTYANLEARPWEAFDPELVRSSRDLDALYREAEKRAGGGIEELAPEAAMELLNSIVCARFTHGDQAVHGFFGNWVLYALGKAHPKFRAIRDPETILKRGHSSLCGDVSYALARLANRAGIEGRLVSLEGHVVMEARYGGKWRMYDPDYEVTGKGDSGVFRGVAELAADPGAVREAYSVRTGGS